MKRFIVATVTLAILFAGFYYAFRQINFWLTSIDPNLAAAIITGMAGLFGILFVQWHTKAKDIAESHRQHKIEVYNHFFDIVDKFLNHAPETKYADEKDIPDSLKHDFQRLNRGMIVWSSPDVIRSWLEFRTVCSTESADTLRAIDKVYRAIRSDLGNSNMGLKTGDLIRSILKDPNELKDK